MSNVLAAIGRGQLQVQPWGQCNRWLTFITVDIRQFGATREDIRLALERENIESRPLWKPMHI